MSTATIIKVCVILAGLGIMAVTFVLHAKKKLTINLAVTWELLGLAAILSGAVPKFSGWSSRLSLGSLACGGAAAYRVPCRVGHVSDDNTDFFSADEKSGTGNAGFSAEPGE